MIYFIECGDLVKIGTASNVRGRLSSLQTGNPTPMTLLGEIPGGKMAESALHRRFRALRVRGEWFRYSNELRLFIEGAVFAAAAGAGADMDPPYGLFDGDSAFFGEFNPASKLLCCAYAQASRAGLQINEGQWSRFVDVTHPIGIGFDPHERAGKNTVLCFLRDARDFECEEWCTALRRLLRKAQEFAAVTAAVKKAASAPVNTERP